MSVGLDAAALAAWERKARGLISGLGARWTASIVISEAPRHPYPTLGPRRASPHPQPTNATVLGALEDSGRKIFALSSSMRADITRDTLADVRSRGLFSLAGAALMLVVASHWRKAVLKRWRAGTGIKRPGAAWRARKAQLGLQPGAARASDQLLNSVTSARLVVERRG